MRLFALRCVWKDCSENEGALLTAYGSVCFGHALGTQAAPFVNTRRTTDTVFVLAGTVPESTDANRTS